MADRIRVIIYDAQLDAMFRRRGMVYNHERRRARRALTWARRMAPKRSRALVNSLHVTEATSPKRRTTGFWIGARAPHSVFVHEGTRMIIFARSRKGMSVPIFPEMGPRGTSPRTRRRTVRGQRAQPFLTRARDRVMP